MPGMWFTIGINRYFNNGPALRTTLVAVRPTGRDSVHGHAGGVTGGASAPDPPSDNELRVGIRIVGHILHVRPVANQGFHSGGSVTPVVFGREGWQVGCT